MRDKLREESQKVNDLNTKATAFVFRVNAFERGVITFNYEVNAFDFKATVLAFMVCAFNSEANAF